MLKRKFPQIIHSWMYGDVDFADAAGSVGETGAAGVDLGITYKNRHNSPAALLKKDIARILTDENLSVLCSTPMHMFPELDYSHPDAAMRQKAVDFTRACLDVVRHAGCDRMTIPPSWVSVKHAVHVSYEDDLKRSEETAAGLAVEAGKLGITLLIEPINRFRAALIHTIAEARGMIARMGADNVAICADTYHITLEEDKSAASAILEAGSLLRCLHIGENNRKPPGLGALDWKSILCSLEAIGFDGPLSYEPVYLYFSEHKVASDKECHRHFQKIMSNGVKLLDLLMESLMA